MKYETTCGRLPDGDAVRLRSRTDVPGSCRPVVGGLELEQARLGNLRWRDGLGATLVHPDGLAWPDWQGERRAIEALAIGGTVCLGFYSLADAIRCKKRLEGRGR